MSHSTTPSIQSILRNWESILPVKPVATLVGTFKDELRSKLIAKALQEKLSSEVTQASKINWEKVINYALAQTASLSAEHNKKIDATMLSAVNQLLAS